MIDLLGQLLLLVALWGGEVHSGYAPRYAQGVMERVARNRDRPPVACMISSPYWPVGTWVHVYSVNLDRVEWCEVMDVSAPQDRARHLRTKRVTELSYEAAMRLCGRNHMADSPTSCPVIVVRVNE